MSVVPEQVRGNDLAAGQVFRSLKLVDYRVKLLHPLRSVHGDEWAVEPSGSSAHGSYTAREAELRNPSLWSLDD